MMEENEEVLHIGHGVRATGGEGPGADAVN
jgi:hypothetical protein